MGSDYVRRQLHHDIAWADSELQPALLDLKHDAKLRLISWRLAGKNCNLDRLAGVSCWQQVRPAQFAGWQPEVQD